MLMFILNNVFLGFTDTEVGCVKFGLITEDTDIIELISLVQTTGREVEESMKVNPPRCVTYMFVKHFGESLSALIEDIF